MIELATITCGLGVMLLLVAERARWRPGIALAKMTASTAFVCVALASGALASLYGQILLGGLVLCWIGDACLLSSGRSVGFRVGIASFLFGHLAFALAFLSLGIDLPGLVLAGASISIAGYFILRWLAPHVPPDFGLAVRCYVVVISAMVTVSIGAVVGGAPLWIALGALGFAVSDLSVARDRFVTPGFANAAWGLPLYFGSQLVLAWSVGSLAVSGA